jgi:hypothetical protein
MRTPVVLRTGDGGSGYLLVVADSVRFVEPGGPFDGEGVRNEAIEA